MKFLRCWFRWGNSVESKKIQQSCMLASWDKTFKKIYKSRKINKN
jgi:hypothetical protein